MSVTNLDDHRNRREEPSGYDGITCPCGEAWYALDGAVCLDRDGTVTGYSGRLTCVGCGQPVGGRAGA